MNEFELLNPEKRVSRAKLSLQIQVVMAANWERETCSLHPGKKEQVRC